MSGDFAIVYSSPMETRTQMPSNLDPKLLLAAEDENGRNCTMFRSCFRTAGKLRLLLRSGVASLLFCRSRSCVMYPSQGTNPASFLGKPGTHYGLATPCTSFYQGLWPCSGSIFQINSEVQPDLARLRGGWQVSVAEVLET